MTKSLIFILSFLFLLCVAAFAAGFYLNSASAFALSSAALVFFVAIFSVGVLDYKIGGNQVTLEKRVGSLEKENTELKQSVTALAKAIYMVSSENAPAFGFNRAQFKLVDDTLAPINHLIDGDIKAAAEEDLKKVIYHDNP